RKRSRSSNLNIPSLSATPSAWAYTRSPSESFGSLSRRPHARSPGARCTTGPGASATTWAGAMSDIRKRRLIRWPAFPGTMPWTTRPGCRTRPDNTTGCLVLPSGSTRRGPAQRHRGRGVRTPSRPAAVPMSPTGPPANAIRDGKCIPVTMDMSTQRPWARSPRMPSACTTCWETFLNGSRIVGTPTIAAPPATDPPGRAEIARSGTCVAAPGSPRQPMRAWRPAIISRRFTTATASGSDWCVSWNKNNPRAVRMRHLPTSVALLCVLGMTGCTSRPPTIAHVHIGHAITGVHVTPNHEGYLVTAERRGREAVELMKLAAASNDLAQIKKNVAAAVHASDSEEDFGVKQAIVMAANHITFAATSDDATVNVQHAAPVFASDITRVVERCELIVLLGKDVAVSTSAKDARPSVVEMGKLTDANMEGEDSNGDGVVGSAPSEYGLAQ